MLKMHYSKLQIWQKAMELAKKIHILTEKMPDAEQYGLFSQMRRASISVPSNIAEGAQRGTNKDFSHFLLISKGSVAELETQLHLTKEFQYCPPDQVDSCLKLTDELQRMIYTYHSKLSSRTS